MKSIFRFAFIMLAGALALTSCGATKYISKADVENITDLALVEPLTQIYYIDANGREFLDDSLSVECAYLVDAVMHATLPVSNTLFMGQDGFPDDFMRDVFGLMQTNAKKAAQMPIPQSLDRFLESRGSRYGAILFAQGFERDRKNYRKAMAAGLVLGIVSAIISFGSASVYSIPDRYRLDTWIAVLDSVEDKVVYINRRSNEASPVSPMQVERELKKLTKDLVR